MNPRITRSFEASVDGFDPVKRSVVARINTSNVDRYNTVILARGGNLHGWRRAGAPVLWEHGRDARRASDPIANAEKVWNNGGHNPTELIAEPVFLQDDFSQQRYEWYRDGVIKGWSVNVLPDLHSAGPPTREELRSRPDWEGCDIVYRSWDMAEFSGVVVPGNVDALTAGRAGELLELESRSGLWLPDEVKDACARALTRGMTGSVGGQAAGGGGVKPKDRDEHDRHKREHEHTDEFDDREPAADRDERDRHEREHDDDDEGRRRRKKVERKIVKEGDEYCVYSEDGSKKLGGPYKSREEAEHRLEQVEFHKHKDEGRSAWTIVDGVGRVVAMYADEHLADASLILLRGPDRGYNATLERRLLEQRMTNAKLIEEFIARVELRILGRV